MKSIGLFYKTNGNEDLRFDVHVNLWNTTDKKAIDFGFKCDVNVVELVLLLPFAVVSDDVIDIVDILHKDNELTKTIFNENWILSSESEQCPNYYKIFENEKFEGQTMYCTSNGDSRHVVPLSDKGYSMIKISPKGKKTPDDSKFIYYRIRIKLKSLQDFAYKQSLSNDIIQSAFTSTHLYDIRINDIRTIPSSVKEIVANDYLPMKMSKLHFYFMSRVDEIINNGSLPSDSRILESKQWEKYAEDLIDDNTQYIAYHWKKTEEKLKDNDKYKPVDNFVLFFRTDFSDIRKYRLLVFLSGALFISMLSSLVINEFPMNISVVLIIGLLMIIVSHIKI